MYLTYDPENVDGKLDPERSTSVLGKRALGVPHRYSTCVHPVPQARDDTSDDHLRDPGRRELEYRADAQDGATEHDGPPPSKPFPKEEGEQRSEQASDFVNRHHGPL
jgi:hypothetical protein